MATSLYKIAEEVKILLEGRVTSVQPLIHEVINAYAFIVKKQWFDNTQFDEQQVDGAFLTVFKNLEPTLDIDTDMYYIVLPSSYLNLPHQAGIVWASNMKDRVSWINIVNWGLYSQLKASLMGGRQVYQVEGNRMYFPKMTREDKGCKIMLKLAIAYDNVDPYEQLNIPPDLEQSIVDMVVESYYNKQNPKEKVREVIN